MNQEKPLLPLVAIVGPTAAGKSTLAAWLAERLGGEVVACDSTQLYRGFDIGTAKPMVAERRGIPHHLIDLLEPGETSKRAAIVSWPLRRSMICAAALEFRFSPSAPVYTLGRCSKAWRMFRSARKNFAIDCERAGKLTRRDTCIACCSDWIPKPREKSRPETNRS